MRFSKQVHIYGGVQTLLSRTPHQFYLMVGGTMSLRCLSVSQSVSLSVTHFSRKRLGGFFPNLGCRFDWLVARNDFFILSISLIFIDLLIKN
jgi:hypothetical protein